MSRWFRHYAGMMRDEKLVRVAVKAAQSVERVMWVWGAILESAGELNDGGKYDFDAAEGSYFLRCDVAELRGILDGLEASGRIGGGVVVRWRDRQFDSDSSKKRQQHYRENRKSQRNDAGSNSHDDDDTPSRDGGVTVQEDRVQITDIEPTSSLRSDVARETKPKSRKGSVSEAFERFKFTYPKRSGSNPWEPAADKFGRAVQSGADPEQIIAGARRYGAEQTRLGKVGTEFIMQAKAWLNQKCWQDYPEDVFDATTALMVPKHDPRWQFLVARWERENDKKFPDLADKWPFPELWLKDANKSEEPDMPELLCRSFEKTA